MREKSNCIAQILGMNVPHSTKGHAACTQQQMQSTILNINCDLTGCNVYVSCMCKRGVGGAKVKAAKVTDDRCRLQVRKQAGTIGSHIEGACQLRFRTKCVCVWPRFRQGSCPVPAVLYLLRPSAADTYTLRQGPVG